MSYNEPQAQARFSDGNKILMEKANNSENLQERFITCRQEKLSTCVLSFLLYKY